MQALGENVDQDVVDESWTMVAGFSDSWQVQWEQVQWEQVQSCSVCLEHCDVGRNGWDVGTVI